MTEYERVKKQRDLLRRVLKELVECIDESDTTDRYWNALSAAQWLTKHPGATELD